MSTEVTYHFKDIETKYGKLKITVVGMDPFRIIVQGSDIYVNNVQMRSIAYRARYVNGEVLPEHYSEPHLNRMDFKQPSLASSESVRKYLDKILPEYLNDEEFIAMGREGVKQINNRDKRHQIQKNIEQIAALQAENAKLESEIQD